LNNSSSARAAEENWPWLNTPPSWPSSLWRKSEKAVDSGSVFCKVVAVKATVMREGKVPVQPHKLNLVGALPAPATIFILWMIQFPMTVWTQKNKIFRCIYFREESIIWKRFYRFNVAHFHKFRPSTFLADLWATLHYYFAVIWDASSVNLGFFLSSNGKSMFSRAWPASLAILGDLTRTIGAKMLRNFYFFCSWRPTQGGVRSIAEFSFPGLAGHFSGTYGDYLTTVSAYIWLFVIFFKSRFSLSNGHDFSAGRLNRFSHTRIMSV
jgi:hypothetical protein